MVKPADDRNTPAPLSATPWMAAYEYAVDTLQRSVLYTDVMRQRGNQYLRHMAKQHPNVLSMKSELVLDGREFDRPVNYGLLRILPPADAPIDPQKRPFLVVDPRAGHGPGIGGFKPESEIGVAVRAGHPCYFASFMPRPTDTQTVEDVMRAEARFLEEIIALHPASEGKPVVVGNCQAGWQIMRTAAMRPELFGPIIVAGAPLSYWAGWRGMNPMRYSGGLLGGSWLTAMASDLGDGRFDGAWLVQNFENLNPANTLWSKQYNLYANVDTEASRYLDFERWWGGHVFLNGPEIQYIVDNLFVGNRLATAGLVTSDGIRIDLRNIRSPIIVFCSKGDNITPPPQALGWIPDLYQDDTEVIAHGQTIVYAVHESIGHLGIFVSGAVARKEHQEFTANIDLIDVLPAGIYQAEIADKTPDTLNADLAQGDYVLSFARRKLDDVRAIVDRKEEDDRRFAAVSRISDINLGLYRSLVQPWIRAAVTPQAAQWMQRLHPLRLPYELISDRNPWVAPVAQIAEHAREQRQPVASDNPFAVMERMVSNNIVAGLNMWQELRDAAGEQLFMNIYGSPLVQDWAGLGAKTDSPPRKHPGISPEHRAFMAKRTDELRTQLDQGGVQAAAIRMMLYVSSAEGSFDERSFAMLRKMRADTDSGLALQEFKDIARDQALMMRMDRQAALQAMPTMLEGASADTIRHAFGTMRNVLEATGPLNERARVCLQEVEAIFRNAAQKALAREESASALKAADTQAAHAASKTTRASTVGAGSTAAKTSTAGAGSKTAKTSTAGAASKAEKTSTAGAASKTAKTSTAGARSKAAKTSAASAASKTAKTSAVSAASKTAKTPSTELPTAAKSTPASKAKKVAEATTPPATGTAAKSTGAAAKSATKSATRRVKTADGTTDAPAAKAAPRRAGVSQRRSTASKRAEK